MAGGGGQKKPMSRIFCEVFPGVGDKLLQFFNEQRHNNSLCDTVIKVEGVAFPAHSCVLGASSDVLLQQLLDVRKDNVSVLSMTNVTFQGFYPLFEYMYTGVLKFEVSRVKEVRDCALVLNLTSLLSIFEQFMEDCEKVDYIGKEEHETATERPEEGLEPENGQKLETDQRQGQHVSCVGTDNSATAPMCQGHGSEDKNNDSNSSADTAPVSNQDDQDPSGLDDYLRFFASLSANAEPIPTGNKGQLQASPRIQTTESNQRTSGDNGNLTQPIITPRVKDGEPQKNNNSNLNEDVSEAGPSSSGFVKETAKNRDLLGKDVEGIKVENESERTGLDNSHSELPGPDNQGMSNQEIVFANLHHLTPTMSRRDGNDQEKEISALGEDKHSDVSDKVTSRSAVDKGDHPDIDEKEISGDDTHVDSGISGAKFALRRKLRRGKRLRKPLVSRRVYSGHYEEGSAPTDMTTTQNPDVYVRSQAPFLADPSLNGIQFGTNLTELLGKHGVSPATCLPIKTVQKRKRSLPRKIRRNNIGVKRAMTNEASLGRRGRKKKAVGEKESSEDPRVKLFNCPMCPRGFFREPSLKKHCEGHAYGGIHKCHVCERSYVRLCDFTRHVRSHGTLRCEYCEFTTKSQKHFVDHNEQNHDSPKPFRCQYMDCRFASSKLHDLDEHRLIHSEVKCFSCDLCGKTFAQKGGLYSHTKSCMQKRGFLCDICGKAFNHLGSMKSHRRTHIGHKPYQCSECNACFSDHRNLKRHQRIHENVFPYACDFCDKRFRHSNSRKSHMTKQHYQQETGGSGGTPEKMDKHPAPINPYLLPLQQVPMPTLSHEAFMHQARPQVFDPRGLPTPVFPGQIHHGAQTNPSWRTQIPNPNPQSQS